LFCVRAGSLCLPALGKPGRIQYNPCAFVGVLLMVMQISLSDFPTRYARAFATPAGDDTARAKRHVCLYYPIIG
jgi:hypothetical protein